MSKYVAAYLGAGLTFAAVDAVWLTTMTNRLYKPVLGPILADKPDMRAAVAFYLISIAGTVFLAIEPTGLAKCPYCSAEFTLKGVAGRG